jgi:hypothetical protein
MSFADARQTRHKEVPADATNARLRFTSTIDGRAGFPTGDLTGTVRIGGKSVGELGVYPNDDDPISTDSVYFDATRFEPGRRYEVTVSGHPAGTVKIGPANQQQSQYIQDPDPAGEDDAPTTTVDPADYAGIVNADNEEGIALAPALRRAGADLGPQGATVTLPDGETVEVGAIEDADEVARVLEGDDAGEVIDADQDAAGGESSGSSNTSSGDTFGAGGVAAVALALAYMIYRRQ